MFVDGSLFVWNNKFLLYLLLIQLLTISISQSSAKTLKIINLDLSKYPTLTAEIQMLDSNGKMLFPIVDDLVVFENSIQRQAFVACDSQLEEKCSFIFTLDRSRSMDSMKANNQRRIELQELFFSRIIDNLPDSNQWECAITSFDNWAEVETTQTDSSIFVNDKYELKKRISNVVPRGGTDYNSGFLYDTRIPKRDGALLVARKSQYKPIVFFFTDGQHNGPPYPPPSRTLVWVAQIIKEALDTTVKEYPADIYTFVLGIPTPSELVDISSTTNGLSFSSQDMYMDNETIKIILRSIFKKEARTLYSCKISWQTDCTFKGGNLKIAAREYTKVFDTLSLGDIRSYISASPSIISFPVIDSAVKTKIYLSCNSDATVKSVKFTSPLVSISDWGGSLPPFNISPRNPKYLELEVKGADSSFINAKVIIETDACKVDTILIWHQADPLSIQLQDSLKICKGDSIPLGDNEIIKGGFPPYKYRWEPSDGLSSANIANPIAFPDSSTFYTLSVSDRIDSTISKSILIVVEEKPHPEIEVIDEHNMEKDTSVYFSEAIQGTENFWTVSNGDIIGNNNLQTVKVKWEKEGDALLTVKQTFDVTRCFASDSLMVRVLKTDISNDLFNEEDSFIAPNIATDFIEINVPANNHTLKCVVEDVRIFDVFGQEVTPPALRATPPSQEANVRIDISSLSPGVYFIRVGEKVGKFVKL